MVILLALSGAVVGFRFPGESIFSFDLNIRQKKTLECVIDNKSIRARFFPFFARFKQ